MIPHMLSLYGHLHTPPLRQHQSDKENHLFLLRIIISSWLYERWIDKLNVFTSGIYLSWIPHHQLQLWGKHSNNSRCLDSPCSHLSWTVQNTFSGSFIWILCQRHQTGIPMLLKIFWIFWREFGTKLSLYAYCQVNGQLCLTLVKGEKIMCCKSSLGV